MPNDDLGQFPTPASSAPPISDQPATIPSPIEEPTANNPEPSTSILEDINAPTTNQISSEPFSTPPIIDPNQTPENRDLPFQQTGLESSVASPAFEETPDVIPSFNTPTQQTAEETPASTKPEPITNNPELPQTPSVPTELPATVVPKGGSSFGAFITLVILLIAGVAIAAAVFLFSQSQQLKQQILEITQTLEKQKTTITPSPSPTIIEFVTPTPEATPSVTPTVSISPTPASTISAQTTLPLTDAPRALKIAINHQPNAQLILIKTENATSPQTAGTKYFFRQDLTTKKYFYVLISGNKEPEVVDQSIYVTPDNNIPSLNDLVLGNTLGIELNEAVQIGYDLCLSNLCKTASVKSQYIKSGDNLIWQLSFTPADTTKETLVLQLNARTKAVLYKSAGF